jgi:hypothetical protein
MTPRDRLNAAALRVTAAADGTVGFWLARHREAEGLTAEDLAAKLHTDARGLALVSLCAAPRPEAFAADAAAIADRCGVDATTLMNILRQEQSLSAWAGPSGSRSPTDVGWVIAAHDADQPPPGDADDPDPA